MKSIYEDAYRQLLTELVSARKAAELTQQDMADALGRPQSFVSKIENGDRRLDVIEFVTICRLIGANPSDLLNRLEKRGRRR